MLSGQAFRPPTGLSSSSSEWLTCKSAVTHEGEAYGPGNWVLIKAPAKHQPPLVGCVREVLRRLTPTSVSVRASTILIEAAAVSGTTPIYQLLHLTHTGLQRFEPLVSANVVFTESQLQNGIPCPGHLVYSQCAT